MCRHETVTDFSYSGVEDSAVSL